MKQWAERFYNSDAWRACRLSFLDSKGFECERCSKPDDPVPATIAHHKEWLTPKNINDPRVTLNHANLEALCQDCHNKEHHKRIFKRYGFDDNGRVIPPYSPHK